MTTNPSPETNQNARTAAPATRNRSGVRIRIACGAVVALHAAALAYGAWVNAPNYLEANLLPAGYLHLTRGRFDIAEVNPPFARMLCAAPLLLFDVHEDWRGMIGGPGFRREYGVGRDFLQANLGSLQAMFFSCRLVGIVFSIVGAWAVWSIAKGLYGELAGLAAVGLWCFCPMVMGHAATVTHDVPGAATLALTFVAYRNLLARDGWPETILCGIAAGAAVLTRTTNLVVLAVWLAAYLLFAGFSRAPRRGLRIGAILASAVLTVNLGYQFSGSFSRLGDFEFLSSTLNGTSADAGPGNRFRGTWVGEIRVPAPRDFVAGLDLQRKDFESPPFESYLCGEWRSTGWPQYYVLAWAVKTPIGFQILFVAACLSLLRDTARCRAMAEEWLLLGSVIAVFALASANHGFTTHYRYVLPAFPFIAVLSGRLWRKGTGGRFVGVATALLVAGVASSLFAFPHSLAYFNEWVGGPLQGRYYLLHSSCDWGQDVYRLSEWSSEIASGDRQTFMNCRGAVEPGWLGMHYANIPFRQSPSACRRGDETPIEPGRYIVSATALQAEGRPYRWLDAFTPTERIGYTISAFAISRKDIEAHGLNAACAAEQSPQGAAAQ